MEKQRIFIDDILSNENMNRAYKQVIKNKGAAGIDGMECNDLFSHLKVNGHQLRESIRNQSYKPKIMEVSENLEYLQLQTA